ncbi:hypothetical protein LIER_27621 [Lithospermum erythrorhizon]|uniref:Reverse transcriptase zinc-binding domain-containing protein n=1 Tax=Lithospermum erythrorhizon TaxID=34254 RepID=A0AAV3RG39_LITER
MKNGGIRSKPVGESSTRDSEGELWSKLWSLWILPLVRNFIWRGLHNSLPTEDKLVWKGMLIDRVCVLCSNSNEDLVHVLVTCPFSSRFWLTTPWNLLTTGQQ